MPHQHTNGSRKRPSESHETRLERARKDLFHYLSQRQWASGLPTPPLFHMDANQRFVPVMIVALLRDILTCELPQTAAACWNATEALFDIASLSSKKTKIQVMLGSLSTGITRARHGVFSWCCPRILTSHEVASWQRALGVCSILGVWCMT